MSSDLHHPAPDHNSWLTLPEQPPYPVVLVGGGPGAPDLITVRGQRALAWADVIIADHLGPTDHLAELCDITNKEIIDAAKLPYGKQMAQQRINELLVEAAQNGRKVVRLKGGDPYVFGRGFEERAALIEAGIGVIVVPGVTSAISVPAAAGVSVTRRGINHSFTVLSGHLAPGHTMSLTDWDALARLSGTLVIIMGVKNGPAIADRLIELGKNPATPVAIIEEGTTSSQRSVTCTLATLGATIEQAAIHPPAVIVVGDVVEGTDN
ncbi:uroporphyrinogen-III C-methyltransferase [Corynebacterium choanae]|uniref:uroporphyrinogen-III C-methyltransferase n=1 Tax=Corynebacterium choanae TaxID=1862358 RepID=A0A3G6JB68_9CORY|nr:uroporphyrinogen-III C-methyltransferase [Corynebacterium choanae]AZA13830.1 Uroporphyrinogen-III C-methyltransferase [Corynebacterium choanae]